MTRIVIFLFFLNYTASAQQKIVVSEEGIENAYPRLSKDGRKILYQSNKDGYWQLYICDMNGNNQKKITTGAYNNNLPDWSSDNKWIAYVSDRDGNEEIYIAKADGTGERRITRNEARDIHPYISPNGKYILFNSDREGNQFDIYRYNMQNGKEERLTNTPDNETCARYAPDMKKIVLLKNNAGFDGVYVLDLSNFTSKDISVTPDVLHGWPMYSYDGKWIYYSSMENGTYSIYRAKPDGKSKQMITKAKPGEEHARVNIARDGKSMIYNIKWKNTIMIASSPIKG